MNEFAFPLTGLSPVLDKDIVARKTRLVLSLPTGSPTESLMRLALDRRPARPTTQP